ncbi:hypothetical protein D6817_01740 [Candidatus Pacearchaeota archaeon]|nr:MAG: hypothetical protein D6817_01740 [Candidatus Pacearchaeota archaeon]
MKALEKCVRELHARGWVSREPHPLVPFVLVLAQLALIPFLPQQRLFRILYILLLTFTIVFALAHWYVWHVLSRIES